MTDKEPLALFEHVVRRQPMAMLRQRPQAVNANKLINADIATLADDKARGARWFFCLSTISILTGAYTYISL